MAGGRQAQDLVVGGSMQGRETEGELGSEEGRKRLAQPPLEARAAAGASSIHMFSIRALGQGRVPLKRCHLL